MTRATAAPREFTVRGLFLGLLLAVTLGAANAYLGLYAGMTVSASIPAAVISMAVLRVLGGATVLENNVVQTIASAGEAVAAGAIFTFPPGNPWTRQRSFLLGRNPAVRSRRCDGQPADHRVAARLHHRRAPPVSRRKGVRPGFAQRRGKRVGAAAGSRRCDRRRNQTGPRRRRLYSGAVSGARWVGGVALAGSLDLSAALVGIGYIVGIQIAAMVLAGGAIAWLLAVPILSFAHPELRHEPAARAASELWSTQVRFLGVGAMLTGGLTTLWRMRRPIIRALGETRRAGMTSASAARPREETDIPPIQVMIGVALCVIAMFVLYGRVSGSWTMALVLAVSLAVIGFFATAVAGYLTGLVGASNNPISGVTLIVLLAIALLLKVSRRRHRSRPTDRDPGGRGDMRGRSDGRGFAARSRYRVLSWCHAARA